MNLVDKLNITQESFICEGNPYNRCDYSKIGDVICKFLCEETKDCKKMFLDENPDINIKYFKLEVNYKLMIQ